MKIKTIFFFLLVATAAIAQPTQTERTETGLGNGLNFALNEDQYRFKVSGFLQPSYQFVKADQEEARHLFRSRRSYLNFSGNAVKEHITFLVQADFSAATPLLDAWIGYEFVPGWTVSAGQRRTFTNNREMTFDEDNLQFADRGLLSTTFSGNGREFGLFLQGSLGKSFLLKPQLALTSGDGANSFGVNASDVDLGGFKYGGRLDILPLGDFSTGNGGFAADLKHETRLRMLVGVAGSINIGASQATGEGHGAFIFYDRFRNQKLPDYRKISADILLKYRGFHVMADFVTSSAANLEGIYTDSISGLAGILKPGQISQFLVLGNAWNAEIGYVNQSGYALNLRFENLQPEFENPNSVLRQTSVQTVGLGRYFKDQKLKLQASVSQLEYSGGTKQQQAEVVMQVVF